MRLIDIYSLCSCALKHCAQECNGEDLLNECKNLSALLGIKDGTTGLLTHINNQKSHLERKQERNKGNGN